MALTVFCIMGWAVIICLATVPGDMQRREGTFVFLMIMNINISFTWIVSEEMKRFILSGKVPEYLAFLISRSVLAPCLVLIFLNMVLRARFIRLKFLVICG